MKLSEKIQERRNDLDVALARLDHHERIIAQIKKFIFDARDNAIDIEDKLNWLRAYESKWAKNGEVTDANAIWELGFEFEEIDEKIKSIVDAEKKLHSDSDWLRVYFTAL